MAPCSSLTNSVLSFYMPISSILLRSSGMKLRESFFLRNVGVHNIPFNAAQGSHEISMRIWKRPLHSFCVYYTCRKDDFNSFQGKSLVNCRDSEINSLLIRKLPELQNRNQLLHTDQASSSLAPKTKTVDPVQAESKETNPQQNCKSDEVTEERKPEEEEEDISKLSIWQKFKKMYKEYWYVLVPVHVATSLVWFGSFYYAARSGIDIVPFLEGLGAGEMITGPLKNTSAGYVAIAYAMYKIATPIRYTVTVGGTTISINYLKKWGVIKPVPSRAELQQMIQSKSSELKEGLRERREQITSPFRKKDTN